MQIGPGVPLRGFAVSSGQRHQAGSPAGRRELERWMRVEDGFCVDLRASRLWRSNLDGLVLIALMQLSSPLGKLPGMR